MLFYVIFSNICFRLPNIVLESNETMAILTFCRDAFYSIFLIVSMPIDAYMRH